MSKSQSNAKSRTKKLSRNDALGILAAALDQCQQAGFAVSVRNLAAGNLTGVGVTLPAVWFCHNCLRLKDGQPKDNYACGCKPKVNAA